MPHDISHALAALKTHQLATKDQTTAALFGSDPTRFDTFHVAIPDLIYDYSKQRVTAETMTLLYDLARAADLEARRAALFAGETVNVTEGRSVLHMALRSLTPGKVFLSDGRDVMPDVIAVRDKMGVFAEAVRSGAIRRRTARCSPISSTSGSVVPTSARRWRRVRCRPSSRSI